MAHIIIKGYSKENKKTNVQNSLVKVICLGKIGEGKPLENDSISSFRYEIKLKLTPFKFKANFKFISMLATNIIMFGNVCGKITITLLRNYIYNEQIPFLSARLL